MFVDISLNCVVSETTSWHARQASATTFPHGSLVTKAHDSVRRALHGVVSDGLAFGLFVPLPRRCDRIRPRPIQAVWNQDPQGKG